MYLKLFLTISFLSFSNFAFGYAVGRAKVIECAKNHSGSCTVVVSKEFINAKNQVTASISLYHGYNSIFSVKRVVSVKKIEPTGNIYEIQVIGDWRIRPEQRKKVMKTQPVLKFIKLYKKQKKLKWVQIDEKSTSNAV